MSMPNPPLYQLVEWEKHHQMHIVGIYDETAFSKLSADRIFEAIAELRKFADDLEAGLITRTKKEIPK